MEANRVGYGATKRNFGRTQIVPPDFVSTQLGIAEDFAGNTSRSNRDQLAEVPLAVVSSCGEGEGGAGATATPSRLSPAGCAESLHELASLFTAIVMNAQVLQWKLPPYSHLKRPLREMERKAQRGSALLDGWMRSFDCPATPDQAALAASPTETEVAPARPGRSVMTQSLDRARPRSSSQQHVTPALASVSQKGMIVVGTGTAADEASGSVCPKGA